MSPALPTTDRAVQCVPALAGGCHPGGSREPYQGSFVAFFLALLVVSGGLGCLPGLAEPGLGKSELKFVACPLPQLLGILGLLSAAPATFWGLGVSFFHVFLSAICCITRGTHINQLMYSSHTHRCEVGTHCIDKNPEARKTSGATQLARGRVGPAAWHLTDSCPCSYTWCWTAVYPGGTTALRQRAPHPGPSFHPPPPPSWAL